MIRDHKRDPEADSQRERRANPDDRACGEATQPASTVRRALPCPALRARMIRDHRRDPEADSQ
eukprot:scaffold123704_cov57-Phaeocystis_antarctica.AAC.1